MKNVQRMINKNLPHHSIYQAGLTKHALSKHSPSSINRNLLYRSTHRVTLIETCSIAALTE